MDAKTKKQDAPFMSDKQVAALEAGANGAQRVVIRRLCWNVRQARRVAAERRKLLEQREDTAELLDRKLPSDSFAEATVLGTLLVNPGLIGKHGLTAAHFLDESHSRLFAVLSRLHERKIPLDLEHLVDELKNLGEWELVGAAPRLADCILSNRPERIQEYAARLEDCRRRRALFFRAVETIQAVHDVDKTTDEVEQLSWGSGEQC